MRPQVYGDPRNPARVSRGSSLHTNGGRFGQPQSFTYQPGRGAGATRVQRQQPATTEGLERQVDRADQLAAAGRTDNATAKGGQRTQGAAGVTAGKVPTPASQTGARLKQKQNQNPNQAQRRNQKQNQGQNLTRSSHAPGPPSTGPTAPIRSVRSSILRSCRRGGRSPLKADAFAPTGVQAGAFLLRPALETTGGYDSNVPRTTDAKPCALISPSSCPHLLRHPRLSCTSKTFMAGRKRVHARLRRAMPGHDERGILTTLSSERELGALAHRLRDVER